MISLVTLIDRLQRLAIGHGGGTPADVDEIEWREGVVRFNPGAAARAIERCAAEIDGITAELEKGWQAARDRGDEAAMDRTAARVRTAKNCAAAVRALKDADA